MTALLVAIGVGIFAYIMFVMLVPKAVPDETDDHVRNALDRLYEENKANALEKQNVMRNSLLEESPALRAIFGMSIFQPLYEAAIQAGYQDRLPQVLIRMGVYALIILLILFELHVTVLAVLLVPPLAYLMTLRHCRRILRKRNIKFIDQFPDALDIIVRSVRSGFPLGVALQILSENAEDPIRGQFQQVVEEIALGRTLQQALVRLAIRIDEPDVRFFVVVLGVQQETGGNLAEIIGNLSTIIRKRRQLRHKIRALTAEGTATGWVLGALPVVVFAILYFFQPTYLDPFFTDTMGQMMFGGVLFLLAICFIVVKQMINVDI